MAAPVLQFKRGLLADLPGLRAGEPGFTTDSYDLYVGLTSDTSTNKFFGSHRYWTKETISTGSGINLVEGTDNGSDYITIKSPNSLAGIVTYTLPGTQGAANSVLTNDGSGNLTWGSGSDNAVFTGITTFNGSLDVNANSDFSGITTFSNTTDNTLGDSDTGAVQLDGGLGVDKNVTVGANLNVQGYAEFVGVSTFGSDLDINASVDISTDLSVGQNLSVTGVSTFTGLVDANGGLDVLGHTELDNVNVSGVSTFTGAIDANGGADISGGETTLSSATVSDLTSGRVVLAGTSGALQDSGNLTFNGSTLTVVGYADLDDVNVSSAATIATADITNATIDNLTFTSGTAITSVDTDLSTVSASDDTLASAKAIKAYVDSQVTAQDLDFAGDTGTGAVDLDSQTFTIAGTTSEIVTSASGQTITIGLPDNVVIGAGLTVTGALDVNGGGTIDNVRIGVAGDNEIDTSTGNLTIDSAGGTTTIDDELIVSGDVRINGNDIKASDGNTNITLTSNTLTTFAGDIRVNGNDIQASDGNVNITMTSNTLTEVKGDLKVTGNDIQSSTATALTLSGANVTVAGDLTVGGNDIKASDGTTALTLADSTGAVTAASDLTVSGNLYVNGSTTQVNTTTLNVKDSLVDLGLIDSGGGVLVPPTSDLNIDVGLLLNYHTGSAAKKAAVYWDDSVSRIALASDATESSSVLTAATYSPIEVGELWINNTCTGGAQQVIGCVGSELQLQNITIDAGTF